MSGEVSASGRTGRKEARQTRRQTAVRSKGGRSHRVEAEQQIRLFRYVERVSKITGKHKAWKILEDLVAEKRLDWLNERRIIPGADRNVVEGAFDLFYRQYLGARDEELEVVERKPDKIVVRCRNPCPTLEACEKLGMDTRFVCKAVYEKPTQAFFRTIHPRLRFTRDYDRIRPYADFCEETVEFVRGQGRHKTGQPASSQDPLGGE